MEIIDPATNYGLPCDLLHIFPAHTIGKHEWRLAIEHSRWQPGARVTAYYWRALEPSHGFMPYWRAADQWPRYNINDGMYGGLPRTLATYFGQYRDAIRYWLQHGCAPTEPLPGAQLAMF